MFKKFIYTKYGNIKTTPFYFLSNKPYFLKTRGDVSHNNFNFNNGRTMIKKHLVFVFSFHNSMW